MLGKRGISCRTKLMTAPRITIMSSHERAKIFAVIAEPLFIAIPRAIKKAIRIAIPRAIKKAIRIAAVASTSYKSFHLPD